VISIRQVVAFRNEGNEIDGERSTYRGEEGVLVGKPEGKRRLGRPRCRWKDNIKMDLQEVGWRGMNWFDLTQNRDWWRTLVNAVVNIRAP